MPNGKLKLAHEGLFREQCFIDGEWVGAGSNATIDVTNPATGEKPGVIPRMGAEGSKYGIDDYTEIKYALLGGVDH